MQLGSVLIESVVFAFNAHTLLSLNCSETFAYMQVKFRLWVEFTAHFLGGS